jgi:hypothetical protein
MLEGVGFEAALDLDRYTATLKNGTNDGTSGSRHRKDGLQSKVMREETRAGHEKLMTAMKAAHEELMAIMETNKEKMMAKFDAHHERMRAKMDSQLEKMETSVDINQEEVDTTDLEANLEETESEAEH